MPHICMDEVVMFMAMIPFIGIFFRRIHAWWHVKFGNPCHVKMCTPAIGQRWGRKFRGTIDMVFEIKDIHQHNGLSLVRGPIISGDIYPINHNFSIPIQLLDNVVWILQ